MQQQSKLKPKILVAEDERLLLSTLADSLEAAGYQVFKAENGVDALTDCMVYEPDLAILDINMPQMSGLKVAEQLKLNSDIPFMFLTAYGDDDFIQNAKIMGAVGFLVKPLLMEQILPEIHLQFEQIIRFKKLRTNAGKMKHALDTNQSVNFAVGIIMERNHLDADTAFNKIRQLARSKRQSVHQIAQDILNNRSCPFAL